MHTTASRLQPELREACNELGIEDCGNKDELASAILDYFGETPADELKPGETVTMNQSAATLSRPMPVLQGARPLGGDDLASRLQILDSTILSKTTQLKQLRMEDKCAPLAETNFIFLFVHVGVEGSQVWRYCLLHV